jgi:hypothetical protein
MFDQPSTINHQPPGRILLSAALVSGVSLMIPLVWAGPLVLDEHGSYWILESDLPGSSLRRSLDYAAIPPLSSWVQAVAMRVAGKSEAAFRSSSALCYLFAIAVTYVLGRDLCGPVAGGIAAIILAWHPEAMDEVRMARCYGLVLLTSAGLLWVTVRWLREPSRAVWGAAWGVAAAAVAWTHYLAVPLAALAWLAVVAAKFRRRSERASSFSLLIAAGVAAALCLPLLPAALRMWEWSPFLNYQRETQSVWRIVGPLWIAGLPTGVVVAWIPGHVLAAKSATPLDSVSARSLGLLAAWSLLPVLLIAVVAHGDLTSLANPRYRVAYAVPGACLLGGLLAGCSTRLSTLCLATAAALAAAWGMSPRLPWEPGRLGSHDAAEWRRAAEIIDAQGQAGQPVFVQSGLIESSLVPVYFRDALFMEYVACRVGRFYLETPHPRHGLPFLWDVSPDMRAFFAELLATNRGESQHDVWVACATDTDLNRRSLEGIQTLLLENGYELTEEWPFSTLALIRYEPGPPAAPP